MNDAQVQAILLVTAVGTGLPLSLFAVALYRRKLLRWDRAGFWAMVAFAFYFVVHPLCVALTGRTVERYQTLLALGGGMARGLWILLVLLVGMVTFFTCYLRAPTPAQVTWGLSDGMPLPVALPFLAAVIFGLYSLILYRTFGSAQQVLLKEGRFIGTITGYEYSGYKFLLMPIAYLLLTRQRWTRALGWLLVFAFLLLSLPHGWARYTVVSVLLLATIVALKRRRRHRPPLLWLLLLGLMAGILQVRGHATLAYEGADDFLLQAAGESARNFAEVLAARDGAMLATLYLESHVHDTLLGFDYGLPLFNYLLSGWMPGRWFPDKYFLIDWLVARRGPYPEKIAALLYATKPTMLGDLYSNGWLFGVILGAGILGYLSRKLDGWLHADSHLLLQAVGIAFISQLWMVWGSDLQWGFIRLGYALLPALPIWLLWRFDPLQKYRLAAPGQGSALPPLAGTPIRCEGGE